MGRVRHNREDVLHEINKVCLKELCPHLIPRELLQECEQNVESYLCHIPHCVLEGPYNRVH